MTHYRTTAITPTPDTQPPTAPGTLTANVISESQINLSWVASTDNMAVTGYELERCQGVGCANFAQIATPSGTSYNNTGLVAGTNYSYRVRAQVGRATWREYSNVAGVAPPDSKET